MDKKGILKSVGKTFKIAGITFLSTITFMYGTSAIVGNITLADYPKNSQIQYIADELDCDTEYINERDDKYIKMQHNNDKPIYVCFDSALNEQEIASATHSLDYVFGIVSKINDNYKYEIVDKKTYDKKIFKNKMYFGLGKTDVSEEEAMSEGYIDSRINYISQFTSKLTSIDYKISINRSNVPLEENRLNYLFTHEILHAFGLDDVYISKNTDRYIGNTYMKSPYGRQVGIITPNDYKCLLSLYTEKFDNDTEKQQTLEAHKKSVAEYEEYYYNYFTEKMVENYQLDQKVDRTQFVWHGFSTFENKQQQKQVKNVFTIKVKDNAYTLEIYDTEKNLLDSATGEVYQKNGVVILKEAQLKEGLTIGLSSHMKGFVQDFVLLKKDNKVSLLDIANNYNIDGVMGFLEIQTELE